MAMARCCNSILVILNLIALLISVPIILIARYLYKNPDHATCDDRYQPSDLMGVGILLLVLSLMWVIGTWCRMKFMLWLHLFVMFLTILGVLISSLTGLVAIRRGEGEVVPQKGRDQYRVEDFSAWMQRHVDNDFWVGYRNCMVEYDYCKDLDKAISNLSAEDYMKNLPSQWGCCKPPRQCGYESKNATFWEIPKSGLASSKDHDCLTYSNHQDTLCYDCDTCKAGYLAGLRMVLKRTFIINICTVIFLMIVSCTACHNLRSKRNSEQYAGYRNEMA